MPYFHCKKCRGIYELQKGESPKNFDICQCGGKLDYYPYFEDIEKLYLKSEKKGFYKDSSKKSFYPQFDAVSKSNISNEADQKSSNIIMKIFILGICLFLGTWLNESWFSLFAPLITGIVFRKNGYIMGSLLGALILGFSSVIAGYLLIIYTLPTMGMPLPSELLLPALITRFIRDFFIGLIVGALGVFIGRLVQ